MKLIETHQFYLAVSMNDLVHWHGDGDDDFEANREIQSVVDCLGLDADIRHLYNKYSHETDAGQGDVYTYLNRHEPGNLLAIDTYRELTDQLDIISIFASASPKLASTVKSKLRNCLIQPHARSLTKRPIAFLSFNNCLTKMNIHSPLRRAGIGKV